MGVRGPIPKSAESREYEGGAAHRPMPRAFAPSPLGIPEKPKGMSAGARRFWDFYVEQMNLNGTLRPIDGPCLEMICGLHSDLQQLEREKRKLIRDRKAKAKAEARKIEGGALLEFEMSVEARRLETTINGKRSSLQRLCDRYGLNPMAGTRLASNDLGFIPRPSISEEVSPIESRIQ